MTWSGMKSATVSGGSLKWSPKWRTDTDDLRTKSARKSVSSAPTRMRRNRFSGPPVEDMVDSIMGVGIARDTEMGEMVKAGECDQRRAHETDNR